MLIYPLHGTGTNKLDIIFDSKEPVFKRAGDEVKNRTEDVPEDVKGDLRDLGYIE